MSPLDGLKKISRPDRHKIYRPTSRINFLIDQSQNNQGTENIRPEQTFYRPAEKNYAVIKIILISLMIFFISGAMYLSEKIFKPGAGLSYFNPFSQLAYLITSGDKRVEGELTDRVNILILGIGGEGHDGPYLTDTIIVASLKPSTGEVALLSIPRDMVVKMKDGAWHKINEVYALGRATNEEDGINLITKTVEDTVGLPINYYGIVTFAGFKDFIDQIGGISINVPVAFTDNTFPTDNFKVSTVNFKAGLQNMDGATALNYARSRHGNNFEGSDFARSRRQQLILQAVKDKLLKFSTLLSPQKLSAIMGLMGNTLKTNISIWQGIKMFQMVKDTGENKIYRLTLDDSPDSLLEPGFNEIGAWVLKPKDGNYQTLARQFKAIFNRGKLIQEQANIAIENGTPTDGLAYWTKVYLEKLGYKVSKYGNALTQDYKKSVIYDLSGGNKKDTLKALKEELNAYVTSDVPENIKPKNNNSNNSATSTKTVGQLDFIIILGQDYADTFKLPVISPSATTTPQTATSTKS